MTDTLPTEPTEPTASTPPDTDVSSIHSALDAAGAEVSKLDNGNHPERVGRILTWIERAKEEATALGVAMDRLVNP